MEPTTRTAAAWILALAFVVAAAPVALGSSSSYQVFGEDVLECHASSFYLQKNCSPGQDDGVTQYHTTGGSAIEVTFTVWWEANSPLAEELRLSMVSEPDCGHTRPDDCYQFERVTGASPLSLTIAGEAARNMTLRADIQAGDVCDYDNPQLLGFTTDCEPPLVRLAKDQPYEFMWNVTTSN